MARIFISHSSKDKAIAERIARDLTDAGHQPWLDEWTIKVGDCITTKIEEGLAGARYVIVLLSPDSTTSEWVSREWKAKYWKEIDENQVIVLPAVVAACDVPLLLRSKRYADLSRNYAVGFAQLMGAIEPLLQSAPMSAAPLAVPRNSPLDAEVEQLLAKVHSRDTPLTLCISEGVALARRLPDPALERFCRNELSGWTQAQLDRDPEDKPVWRLIAGFIALGYEINLQYFGWGESADNIFQFMRQHPKEFKPWKFVHPEPLSEIIATKPPVDQAHKALMTFSLPSTSVLGEQGIPGVSFTFYAPADSHAEIVERIRSELVRRLLAKLGPAA